MATGIDYAAVIYEEHLRSRGGPGDLVQTYTARFLRERFSMDGPTARRTRDRAHKRLKDKGWVERVNERGPYFRILK